MSGAIDNLRMVRAWMGSGDMGDIKLPDDKKVQFRDADINIQSSADGVLQFNVDTSHEFKVGGDTVFTATSALLEMASGKNLKLGQAANPIVGETLTGYIEVQDSGGNTIKLGIVS